MVERPRNTYVGQNKKDEESKPLWNLKNRLAIDILRELELYTGFEKN